MAVAWWLGQRQDKLAQDRLATNNIPASTAPQTGG